MEQSPQTGSADDEAEELRRDWTERVATGRPILTYEFDVPLTLRLDPKGQLELDCPCLRVGNFEAAGIVRVKLSAAASQSLKEMVAELDRHPYEVIFGSPDRARH
jgi:hypothetical protein